MKQIGISNFATRQATRSRGFSLTELAIVLGIAGIILGGIWVLASQTWENARQEQLKENIFTVVKNVRAFYAGQSSVSGVFTVLTPRLAALNPPAIPGDMLRTGAPCTLAVCADHSWGASTAGTAASGSFGVCAWDVTVPACTVSAEQFFAIELDGVAIDRCIKAVLRNSGADAPPGLYDVVINGTSIINSAGVTHQLPVKLTDASAKCTNSSTIDFVYRIVQPQS